MHLDIRRHRTRAEAEVEPAVRQVVQKCQAAGHVNRVMVLKTDRGGAEPDGLRHTECPRDKDLGHHDVLDRRRVMLADPDLV